MTDVAPPTPAKHRIWPILVILLVLIVGAGGFLWFVRMQNESPATVLPAQYTLAYIGNAEEGTWKSLIPFFPQLESVPALHEKGTILAVLKNGSVSGWMTFTPAETTQGLVSASPLARFRIESSSPELQTLLAKGPGTLELSPVFAALAPGKSAVGSWAFVDLRSALRIAQTDVDTALRNAVQGFSYGLYSETPTGFELHLLRKTDSPSVSAPLALATTNDTFFVADASPRATWKWLLSILNTDKSLVAEGRLGALAKDVFGKDMSVAYTLAPLVDAPGTVELLTGTGGSTAVLVRGSMEDSGKLKAIEATLFESLHQSIPQASVDRHKFDQGFSAAVIYQDPTAVQEQTTTLGAWTLHTLTSTNAHREFAFARNGTQFAFSTSIAALTDALRARTSTSTGGTLMMAGGNGILLNRGTMTVQQANIILRSFGISMQSALFPRLQQSKSSIHWIVLKQDDVLVLRASLMDK